MANRSHRNLAQGALLTAALWLTPQIAFAQAGQVHQHGVGYLNAVLEGNVLALSIQSPGMDLVGFEHEPRTQPELEAISALRARLRDPDQILRLPAAAACVLSEVEIERDEHDHDHDHHHEEDHDHDKEHSHDHQAGAGHGHSHGQANHHEHQRADGHGHSHEAQHQHEPASGHNHAHGDHGGHNHDSHSHDHEATHNEWTVTYLFACDRPEQLTHIELVWFDTFPDSARLQYQAMGPSGQSGGNLTPDNRRLAW